MNRLTMYLVTLGVFLTATSELVVSGILYHISEDLHISLALAGQLITAYSLSFAIGTPILVSLTARMDRKRCCLARSWYISPEASFPLPAMTYGC